MYQTRTSASTIKTVTEAIMKGRYTFWPIVWLTLAPRVRITAGKKDWDKTFSVNNDVVDYSQACHPFMKEMEVRSRQNPLCSSANHRMYSASKGATLVGLKRIFDYSMNIFN